MIAVLLVLAAYLVGAFPTSYLVGRGYRVDLRVEGSGNLGATDMVTICTELEALGRCRTFDGVAERLQELDEVFAGTMTELERLRPPAGGALQAVG